MNLTPDQKQAVASWVAGGDSLSAVQKKLLDQFQLSMTYMDVRFLVDDLNLALKDPAPKADANDVSKSPARPATPAQPEEKKGLLGRAKEKLGFGKGDDASTGETLPDEGSEFAEDDGLGNDFGQGGGVTVSVDKVTLIPGAVASGEVTFSDGVTGKWIVDNYGRPGFTEVSQPGYRPSPADAQSFMQELNLALQRRGL